MVHELKTWAELMPDISSGKKPFEVRKNDRGYKVGDLLRLEGWDHQKESYTGWTILVEVTYILEGGQFGIRKGFVVMAISFIEELIFLTKRI